MTQLRTKGVCYNVSGELLSQVIESTDSGEIICFAPQISSKIIFSSNIINSSEPHVLFENSISGKWEEGDVLLVKPNGFIYSLFRKKSPHNSLFLTERCNSNCLMCSQPPKNHDDLDYFFNLNTNLVSLIPASTKELGITGGEPTLLEERFMMLLKQIKLRLPQTEIHILTNGRRFAWKDFPELISRIENPRMVFGVPLYSDYYQQHDFIVQSKNAFDQTMLGFHNMARYGLRLELRIVLHKQSYERLPKLAKYIFMNLPFIEHVAFMGLEYTGYVSGNSNLLWMEPHEYENQLEEAVLLLNSLGMTVSIYNLPLCLLKNSIRKFARKSISDWKQEYQDECINCQLLDKCGGVFTTSRRKYRHIQAVS